MNTNLIWTVGTNSPRIVHAPANGAEVFTCETVVPTGITEARVFTASDYGQGQNMFRRWTLRDENGAQLATQIGTVVNIRVVVGRSKTGWTTLIGGQHYTFTGRIENPDGTVPDDVVPPLDFYIDFKHAIIGK